VTHDCTRQIPADLSRYLADSEATLNAHDDEGWYRTGDIARQENGYYFIVGRASVDIIKSGGYKISAIDIERECLSLPYVSEAAVVGIEDEEYGQRVGAIIFAPSTLDLTLAKLRLDLRGKLAGYKLPTILRLEREELPKTATGKVQKNVLGPKLIPSPGYLQMSEVQVWKKSANTGIVPARL
jgi:malonyl-CoA/methylmalonyl-CoA synthetase